MFGGVRFGGTLTVDGDSSWVSINRAVRRRGTADGDPDEEWVVARCPAGVRFLMALQLTGAAKTNSVANLQLRMPVVVIGGGLTAIDTATESLAYYVVQVEKFLERYEALAAEKSDVRAGWSVEEIATADEFLAHGRAIRAERAAARAEGREPIF